MKKATTTQLWARERNLAKGSTMGMLTRARQLSKLASTTNYESAYWLVVIDNLTKIVDDWEDNETYSRHKYGLGG
jgi:hypothetical protein